MTQTTSSESRPAEAVGRTASGVSPEARRLSEAVTALVPFLRQEAVQAEEQGYLTDAVVARLSELRVFDILSPREYGGFAMSARDMVEVIQAVASGDGSAAWLVSASTGNHVMLLAYPQPAIDEVFAQLDGWQGPIVIGASLFATHVGEGRRVDGGLMVRGKWGFGSGSHHAAWSMAGVEFEDGGRQRRGQVLLSRDQYQILDDWKVSGLSATGSNTLKIDEEIFVPDDRFVDMAELGDKMAGLRGKFAGDGFTWGPQARVVAVSLSAAANALGMARGALECFIEQAPKRKPFNLPYASVADMPSTQVTAGKVRAMISVAGAAIESIANEVDSRSAAGEDFSDLESPDRHMDLTFAIRLCADAVDALQVSLGSSTASLRNPIQRFARDIRVLSLHGAIRFDPMAEIDGRAILGLPPLNMFAGGLPNVG